MIINSRTKIAFLIKKNPEALEVIAGISPRFERLRNPLLRKLLAGRTSIREAARIGKCEVEDIVEALKPLGFEYVEKEHDERKTTGNPDLPPFAARLDELPRKVLDVRQDLAEGKDPLKKIMSVTRELPSDHVLELINTFEPTPLINLLSKKGYENYVKEVSPNEIHTFFKLKTEDSKEEITDETPESVPKEVFEAKLKAFEDKVQPVDVSNLEMPMPMVTILEALEGLPEGYVLSVQHRRIPVFLFNELKERKAQYLLYVAGDTDVKLLIYRED